MWLLLSAVVTASLLGSLHCVGMCGPLAIWAAGMDRNSRAASVWLSTSLYHVGRGLTYALAGFIAGGLGQLLDWSGGAIGIQLLAARLVGGLMIVLGVYSILKTLRPWAANFWRTLGKTNLGAESEKAEPSSATGTTSYVAPRPNWITAQLLRLRPLIFRLPTSLRGLVVGLLTALLPCGWLYLFALLAAGTGSMKLGALVMLAFWLGSVPLLVGLVAGTQLLNGRAGRLVPFAASILLVVAGAYTASGRGFANLANGLNVSSILLDQLKDGKQADSMDAATIEAGLEQLVATPLPCCQNRLAQEQVGSVQVGSDVAKSEVADSGETTFASEADDEAEGAP